MQREIFSDEHEHFRSEFRRCRDYPEALRSSMLDVGRALFVTSVVLVVGFLVFWFSSLDTLVVFGSVLATTIGVALLADFLLMPALVLTFEPFGPATSRPQPVSLSERASAA